MEIFEIKGIYGDFLKVLRDLGVFSTLRHRCSNLRRAAWWEALVPVPGRRFPARESPRPMSWGFSHVFHMSLTCFSNVFFLFFLQSSKEIHGNPSKSSLFSCPTAGPWPARTARSAGTLHARLVPGSASLESETLKRNQLQKRWKTLESQKSSPKTIKKKLRKRWNRVKKDEKRAKSARFGLSSAFHVLVPGHLQLPHPVSLPPQQGQARLLTVHRHRQDLQKKLPRHITLPEQMSIKVYWERPTSFLKWYEMMKWC